MHPAASQDQPLRGHSATEGHKGRMFFKTQPKGSREDTMGSAAGVFCLAQKLPLHKHSQGQAASAKVFSYLQTCLALSVSCEHSQGSAVSVSQQLTFLCSSSKHGLSNRERAQALKDQAEEPSSSVPTQRCPLSPPLPPGDQQWEGKCSSLCWEWMGTALQESPFTTELQRSSCHGWDWRSAGLETHGDSAALPEHPLEEWSRRWQRNLGKIISSSHKAVKKGGGRCEGTERQLMCESSLNWHPRSKKNLCCDVLRVRKKETFPPSETSIPKGPTGDLLWKLLSCLSAKTNKDSQSLLS